MAKYFTDAGVKTSIEGAHAMRQTGAARSVHVQLQAPEATGCGEFLVNLELPAWALQRISRVITAGGARDLAEAWEAALKTSAR